MRNRLVTVTKPIGIGLLAAASLGLAGCVSLGAELPDSLLTLTPTSSAPVGAAAEAGGSSATKTIAVLTPETPAKLDVLRVPVNVSKTEVAYLPEAIWVEKPARLFRRVLGESLRARAGDKGPFVIDNDDAPVRASSVLRGTLIEMSYDVPTSSVVVRYDAVRSDGKGKALTKRFEARESGIEADVLSVAPALNRAANTVAGEVADWMMQ